MPRIDPRVRTGARGRDSAATRRAILDAAGALLATLGEEGLSIREVCARAGVTAPTVYHHFGDKQALVDRVVDDCFASFDRAFLDRPAPSDPVEALRWGLDRYLEYGTRHPVHYQLMFQRAGARLTPAAMASYDRLRRAVAAIAAAGRLGPPVEAATAAFWAAIHGVTSLIVTGGLDAASPAVALVRDAMVERLTTTSAAGGRIRSVGKPRARAAARSVASEKERRRWQRSNRS